MVKARSAESGVAIGKFNPPHLGHLHLIVQAAAHVDRLYVFLCDRPDQTISVQLRHQWLQDVVPKNVTVLVTPDDLPAANEPWSDRVLEVLGQQPDLAFTSEEWGPGWAALMGAEHVLIDLERATFPISGTALRTDLRSNFEWLVPPARAALARRVVLIGAESSGKSTMAEALADKLGTVWVPEHGRWYWEGRRYLRNQSWTTDEFLRIAKAQRRLEDDLARKASNGVIVADTDALVTAVWHERYLGRSDENSMHLQQRGFPTCIWPAARTLAGFKTAPVNPSHTVKKCNRRWNSERWPAALTLKFSPVHMRTGSPRLSRQSMH